MFFLSGVARYLFVPLAEAVVFAMLASYFLSRTLVPTLAMYLLTGERARARRRRAIRWRVSSAAFERGFERIAHALSRRCSTRLVRRRAFFVPVFLVACCLGALRAGSLARAGLLPDHRQRPVHPARARQDRHAHRGDRAALRPGRDVDPPRHSGARDSTRSSTTSACRTARINLTHSTSGVIGAGGRRHHGLARSPITARPPTTCGTLRATLPREFPGRDVLLPAGRHRHADPELRPARADRHPDRRRRPAQATGASPTSILAQLRHVPGLVDAAHPAALRLPEPRRRRRPHQGRCRAASPSAMSPTAC